MTRWLTGTSLRFGWGVLGLVVLMAVVAVPQLRASTVDVYPEFRQTQVEVQAEALGLSAVEVEQLITVPLEQDLLNGVPFVERITSKSIPGLSSVELTFEEGTDLYQARQLVTERMAQAHALPGVGTPPVMLQPRSSVNRVGMIAMKSDTVSPIDMSVLARWQLRPRLLGIPGVANVSVWGQRDRQLQVQVDPQRLSASGVTLTRLIETTGNAMWVSPLSFVEASTPGTGGFVETPNQRLGVQHVSPITTPDALSDVVIEGGSAGSKRIGDVATVVEDHQPLIGDASVNGDSGLLIMIDKFPGADPAQVSRDVAAAMADMQVGLPGITVDTTLYRPAGFIADALTRIGWAALIGLLLMVAVVGALVSWRAAVIALLSVPASVTAALYVLHLRGTTFTAMTVVGLSAGLVLVVDDVVGDVHRFRERRRLPQIGDEALSRRQLLVDVVGHGRVTVLYATIVALLLAAPLLFIGGVPGAFTRQAAVTYAIAVVTSLVVALTLTPVLAALLGTGPVGRDRSRRAVDRAFDAVAGVIYRRVPLVAGAAVLLLVAAAVAVRSAPGPWLPDLGDRNLLVRLETSPGTSLAEMTRVSGLVAQEVRGVDGVAAVAVDVGRALTSDRVVDVNSAELWVSVAPEADAVAATLEVRQLLAAYPGVRADLRSYSADRIQAATPENSGDLVVRVYGGDYAQLTSTGDEVARMLSTVRGVVSPRVEAVPTQPTVRIEVDLARARTVGLKPGDVRRETATLISGLLVGSLYEDQKIFDVVVWGGPAQRHSPSTLSTLLIDTPSGRQVQLGDVASVTLAPEPVVVAHDAVLRHVDVVATLPSRDRGAVASEVTQRLRAMQMPFEYRAEVVDTAAPAGSGAQLWWWALAALLTVLLVIQAALRSWRRALLLVLALPLALAGALPAAGAVGGPATAGAVAGMVGVLALTVRHGLAVLNGAPSDDADDMGDRELVDAHASDGLAPDAHAGNGHVVGGEAWDGDPGEGRAGRVPDAISGARRQAFPMLVSVAAVAALFAPAAVAAGAGMEFLHPAAVVLLAGLVTAVPVTLILLPGLAVALAPASSGGAPTAPAAKAGGADRPPELVATTTAGRPQPSLEGN